MSCERWTGIAAGVFAGIAPVDRVSDYHSMTHRNDAIRREVRVKDGRARLTPYEAFRRFISLMMRWWWSRRVTGI